MNMNILELKKFDAMDVLLLALFVAYIVFPVPTPEAMVPLVDSPLGMLVMFVVTVSLFVYRSPILGVLYIFVAYELLRRTHHHNVMVQSQLRNPVIPTQHSVNRMPRAVPTQEEKNLELQAMNPPSSETLEEEIVAKEMPVGVSKMQMSIETSFHPTNDKSSLGMSMV